METALHLIGFANQKNKIFLELRQNYLVEGNLV